MSLDGVIQAPGGPEEDTSGGFKYGGWTAPFFDEEAGEVMAKQMKEPFSLLLGRKTYEIFAGYWPKHEAEWPGVNSATKYVASKTLTNTNWRNSVILKGDIIKELKKIINDEGPDIQVYGSSDLVQTLLKADLVDELWLKIFPITLGEGKKLFAGGTIPASFKLTENYITKSGVIFANYKRAGVVKTGTVG